jgi:hypothetical protein
VFLTIGAYLSDASTTRTSASASQSSAEQRSMVNWDVVSRNRQSLLLDVRANLCREFKDNCFIVGHDS